MPNDLARQVGADLTVPLSAIPEAWPAGLPLVRKWNGALSGDGYTMTARIRAGLRPEARAETLADLSAPPVDEHGSPLRMDALPVALGWLGRRNPHWTWKMTSAPWFPVGFAWDTDEGRRAIVAAALRAGVGVSNG